MQSTKLAGQPIICQLLSLIPNQIISKIVAECESDKYYKTLKTYKQLVFMLYGVINKSESLTNLCKCSIFLENKLSYVGITELPAKSTLSDANINRNSEVFEKLYYALLEHFKSSLSSIFMHNDINGEAPSNKLKRFDSTTITLFSDVFKGAGRLPVEGSKMGGIKAQTLLAFNSLVPEHIVLGDAAKNDKDFLGQLVVKTGHLYVFDKGYVNYQVFKKWTDDGVYFVTRLNENASYTVIKHSKGEHFDCINGEGILSDEIVKFKLKGSKSGLELRLVTYKDPESGKILRFVTNHLDYKPLTIALIYKNRWQIEVFFKQLKQNFQLDYFFSDSLEGIKTQIWIVMIANLIFSIFHKRSKENESFTTIVSMARQGMCSYVCFTTIINETKLIKNDRNLEKIQLTLFEMKRGGCF
ncbi:MAG: IS4 family transposase [Bacteroidetes bacterium]|nr:MAG: IS4 family transposase [Bacteroidota bacterium]